MATPAPGASPGPQHKGQTGMDPPPPEAGNVEAAGTDRRGAAWLRGGAAPAAAFPLLAAVLVVQGLVLRWGPVDDAYISFRYARNLARGAGLAFNAGQRVEGYTNFLWTVVLAGAARLGMDIPRAAVCLGVGLASLSLVLTWLLGRSVGAERNWRRQMAWAAPAILAFYPGWAYWAFSGMEGPLLACLVLGFLLTSCRPRCGPGAVVAAGVIGVLAAMTLWEAVLLWPVGVLAQLWDRPRGAAARFGRAALLAAVLLAGFGAYFAWRYGYRTSRLRCGFVVCP